MTEPRQIIPQTTYLVTRRCAGRQFFLRPDQAGTVQHIFEYCLAYAALMTGVTIHAYCVLSNHWHGVVTDPNGRLPEFMHDVNMYLGKCMNVVLGRFESLWSSEKYSAVALKDDAAVKDKIAYVITNPVEAALVSSWKKWPGAISGPRSLLEEGRTIERPALFFRDKGPMPKKVKLVITIPPAFEKRMTPEEFADHMTKRVDAREKRLLSEHAEKGKRLMGAAMVCAQDPFSCPSGFDPRNGINPRIACKDKWKRIEMLQRLKSFLEDYRRAWQQFKKGMRDVVFPAGTYWMVQRFGVATAPLTG